MTFIPQKIFKEARELYKAGGFKAVVHRFGWKVFAAFFIYYLVRDLTLYILLPWYLAQKIF